MSFLLSFLFCFRWRHGTWNEDHPAYTTEVIYYCWSIVLIDYFFSGFLSWACSLDAANERESRDSVAATTGVAAAAIAEESSVTLSSLLSSCCSIVV